jgi:hypothetical protein
MIITNVTLKLEQYGDKNKNQQEFKDLSLAIIFDSDPFENKIESTLKPEWSYFKAPIYVSFFFGTLILSLIGFLLLLKGFRCINVKINASLEEFIKKFKKL